MRLTTFLSFATLHFLVAATAFGVELHVSPTGNDANAGTADKPLLTFAAAQKAARVAIQRKELVTVLIHRGTYYLPETVVFTSADSGTAAAPVTYSSAPGEEAIISGAIPLKLSWTPWKDGILKAIVPPVPGGGPLAIDQLVVGGKVLPMARYPNFDPAVPIYNGFAADAISPQRVARWADPAGGFIHAMHAAHWGGYHYRITGKDASGKLTYEGGWQNNRQMGMHAEHRFVENIFEELDAPGEWFFDAKTSTLYLMPLIGVDLAKETIEAVRLRSLIEFRGTEQEPVRFVCLKGISFRNAARTFMDTKEPLLRSDWTIYRGGAIFFTGTEDCTIEECALSNLGGNAVFASNYNRRLAIRGCHITEVGGNGVAFVGDPAAVRDAKFEYGQRQKYDAEEKTAGPKSNNFPADSVVEDCLIHRTGRVEKQSAGVEISMSRGITVRHCSIYEVPRAGINIGDGCWGGHLIEFCDVFDTVLETGDHGSFNSWGRDRFWDPDIGVVNRAVAADPELPFRDAVAPTVLRNSRWRCEHGWDIDLDDGSTNYEIYNNLCLAGGLKNREGYRRIVTNNIIVNNTFHPHVWYEKSGDIFARNIVTKWYAPVGMPKVWGAEVDHNLLSDEQTLTASQAAGRDKNSLGGNPQFVDPASGNYRVEEGSPALKAGFKNFRMDQFGVQRSALKAIARVPTFDPLGGKAESIDLPLVLLGAKVKSVTTLGEQSAAGLPEKAGAMLLDVPDGTAAAKAGLRKTDVILSFANKPVRTVGDLQRLLKANAGTGDPVDVKISRDQKEQVVKLQVPAEVVFEAADAQFVGEGGGPVYDAAKNYVGSWTNATRRLEWKPRAVKPGRYTVQVELAANPGSTGTTYKISAGDAMAVTGKTVSTGGWETFVVFDIGVIEMTSREPVVVKLEPIAAAGAVMNFRRIILTRQLP